MPASTKPPQPRSRALWALFEPIHAVIYYSDEAREPFLAAGVHGFWRSYFAARAAPLGVAPASVVTSLFYGFAPRLVERALPALWDLITPEASLQARVAGAVAGLTVLPGWPDDAVALARAADLARAAVESADLGGRPLGAANASRPWPEQPVAVLWHAATVLRELRGDGHVAALLTAGLTGRDSVVLRTGLDVDPVVQQQFRGWTDEEWQAEAEDLQARGLLTSDLRVTEAGRAALHEVEIVTDELAAQPWKALGGGRTAQFAEVAAPFAAAVRAVVPEKTPLGLISSDGP
jgi:hypothetical protein